MPSAVLDLDGPFEIEQHVDFLRTFQVNDSDGAPYDLTGVQLVAQIKRPLQRGTPNAELAVTVFDPPTAGAGLLALSRVKASALNTREPYKWDFLMRQAGVDTRLAMGDVVVSPNVSVIEGVAYFGKSALSGADMDAEAEIIAALSGAVISGSARTITYAASTPTPKFLYYAYPASYGPLVSAMIEGFESIGDFEDPETIDFSGVSHLVYRSTNALQGAYTVEFS